MSNNDEFLLLLKKRESSSIIKNYLENNTIITTLNHFATAFQNYGSDDGILLDILSKFSDINEGVDIAIKNNLIYCAMRLEPDFRKRFLYEYFEKQIHKNKQTITNVRELFLVFDRINSNHNKKLFIGLMFVNFFIMLIMISPIYIRMLIK